MCCGFRRKFRSLLTATDIAKDQVEERTGMEIPEIPETADLGEFTKREFSDDINISGDNYFVFQARIVFLCFSMEIDVRIIPGPPDDGGGIFARFTFLWKIGNQELTYIKAELDVVPFDFSAESMKKLATDPVGFILDIYIYMGITIRPTIINVIMEFIEPALRIVLMAVIMPLAVAVFIAQKILDLAIQAIEFLKKAVRAAYAALDAAEVAAGKALNRIAGKYLRYQRMEDTANVARHMSTARCESSIRRNSKTGCLTYNGKEQCTWQPSREFELPKDCGRMVRHWKARAGAWRDSCCGFWTRIKRVFYKILYVIAKIVVYIILLIPKIILKIVEGLLTIAEIALKLAEMALKIALCLVLSPMEDPMLVLTKKHHISLPKLARWLWKVKILRVYELMVAGKFDQGALSLRARADFVFLSKSLDLGITFSLDFKDLVAGFAETVKDLMGAIVTMFGATAACIASVVINSKPLVSLGWNPEPHPPDQQPSLGLDLNGTAQEQNSPKLGMGRNGEVVREIHVDHIVANFARRHAAKLGPRARLPWVAGTSESEGKSAAAVLGARPLLPDRIEATDFEGEDTEVEETLLGIALRWEHEAHVTAVAAAAAARKAHGEGRAAAVAAHALGVALDVDGRLHIAPEWRQACVASDEHTFEDAADHCSATAYAAAVACTGAEGSKTAARACASALSSLASKHCADLTMSKSCVAKTADALSCSTACGDAVAKVSRNCGGFVLRGEHGDHESLSSEACSDAVRGAQSSCAGSDGRDEMCMSLLEAVPAEEHASIHADAADNARAHIQHRQATLWREQHARGVLPTKHVCQGGGHLDLRDNVLVGSVPACAWSLEAGRGSLLLSRNMLSGEVGKLGAHVTTVHANENRFTGSLDKAFSEARDLEIFDVAHNRLSGDLGAALDAARSNSVPVYSPEDEDDDSTHEPEYSAPLSNLRVLHVEGNELTDSESRPVVHAVLSKMHSLRSYDISGNKFHLQSRVPPAQGHVAVHAVLHIDADTRHLCPGVPVEGFAHNCGEMLAEVDKSNLGAVDCAVRSVAESALPDDGERFAIALRRERVMPFKTEGTIISYTIQVTRSESTTSRGTKQTVAEVVAHVRDAVAKLSESKDALKVAAKAGGCPIDRAAFLSAFPVREVDARLGCAPGLHGKSCRYACMGRWERHDALTPAPHNYYADYADKADEGYVTPVTTRELITHPEKSTAVATPKAAARLGREGDKTVREVRRHRVQHWEGDVSEKHHRAASLTHCTISCRGHANRAMGTCHDWLDNRHDLKMRRQCASHLKDMGQMCGVTLRGAKSQCGSYVKPHEQEDEHGCQVCGIHRYFEQHGAYGGGQSHYTTYDFSVNSNGHYTHNAVHLSDPKRRAKAIADEEAAKSAALGLNPAVPPEPSRGHMARAAEEYMRSSLAEHAPHAAISRAVNDGVSNALDVADGEGDDASHLADVHHEVFGGMTLRTAMDSQFATCRGDERCSETCVLSSRSAVDTCMQWLHADDELADSAECSKSLDAARARCSPEERSRCLEPLAAGFHALGVPGGEMVADILDDEDVKKHSRSLLTATQKMLGELVMSEFPASTNVSASYRGDDRSWPNPEEPVELMAKGKRNFDLVSSVCRPAGITEQEIAMTCMKEAKWIDGGVSRVELGWDIEKKWNKQQKEEAKVAEELMDESDAPEFECNIPYLGLDYNNSLDVQLVVTDGHVQCGAEMHDGQKILYDFYVEARMKPKSAPSTIYPRGVGPFEVSDIKVKYHAFGKTKKHLEKVYRWEPEETAKELMEKDFASAGYRAEARFYMKPSEVLAATYNVPSVPWVILQAVDIEFDGPAHATAPRLAKSTAVFGIKMKVDEYEFVGTGQLPFPLTNDRPLVLDIKLATKESEESDNTGYGTVVIYPNATNGGSYATLRAFINNTDAGSRTAAIGLAFDYKKMYDSEITFSGRVTSWDSADESGQSDTVEYEDGQKVDPGDADTKGDTLVYIPGGMPDSGDGPDAVITLAANKRKAVGCRSVVGGVSMKLGAINPGREGGFGMFPNPLEAPAWGTLNCAKTATDPTLVLTVVKARYAPWPDDDAFVLLDVVIKLSVTMVVEEEASARLGEEGEEEQEQGPSLNDGNLVGTVQASMDLSSRSYRGLPPLGGWSKIAMTFYTEGGDLVGAYESSSWSVSGVLDSRLGDVDRPYARIVAPIEASIPCDGVIETTGSIYANIHGIFRLQAENVPMNISCGGEQEDEDGNRIPKLAASAELDLIILPPDAFNQMLVEASASIDSAIDRSADVMTDALTKHANLDEEGALVIAEKAESLKTNYDGSGITVPFMKTMKVTARHVEGPIWYWDGDLVAHIGGKTSQLQIGANATFRTNNGFPPDATIGMHLSYEHEMFDIYAAASFPVGECYDPYRYFGEVNIHPPESSPMGNGSFNMSLTQYCMRGDGTTEYFFTAQITEWDVVPGVFGIPHGLIEGTLIREGNAGGFKYWKVRLEGTIGILGASDGKMPEFGNGVILSMRTWFGSEADEFRIELEGAFQIEKRTDSTYFKLSGKAEFAYPCVKGDRIGGMVNVSAEAGEMIVPGVSGAVFFYCGVNGTESPVLEVELRTYGVVQFVKGFSLDNFELLFNAYKDYEENGDETWYFSGSVSATLAIGEKHGASIDFMFDTRDGSWGVAVGYEMTSPNVNLTLKAGISNYCKPEGQYIKGAIAVKIGEEGYLYGSARGAKHCGDYRRTKGVVNVRAAIDEAKIKTDGMLMYLENIELKVRGVTRDELITAEGFLEAQAELPVAQENPYFEPAPGYGRRKLLLVNENEDVDPRVIHNFKTKILSVPDITDDDNQNKVFQQINGEGTITYSAPDRTVHVPTLDCLEDDESGGSCPTASVMESNVHFPICEDDASLMSGFMFARNDPEVSPKCRDEACSKRYSDRYLFSIGNRMTISYSCLKQPSYADPFGECRTERKNMHTIIEGGGERSDPKLLEAWEYIGCDAADEALKSIQTTTNPEQSGKLGWELQCCDLPAGAGKIVRYNGTCFFTAPSELDYSRANPDMSDNNRWEDSVLLTHLMNDKGMACGTGEVLVGWRLESCAEISPSVDEGASKSRFVWNCRHVGGIHSPPPPAPPPPAPPVDDSIENLDWIGNFSGNAKIAFGEDLDDAMMKKTLGIIKVNASFSILDGEFKLDKLLISAAVSYIVPAAAGSWQAAQGFNELEITGFAKLNYPCQSMIDPFTNEPRSLPLVFGEVSAKMAMGSETDPLIIGGANGAKGTLAYHCWGGQKIEVYLECGMLKMENVRLEDIIINITLTENKEEEGDDWWMAGSIEGKIAVGSDMNKEGSEQSQAMSISGAYIFDTSVPFFDVAVKLELGPFDKFYMAFMMRITRGVCSRQGDYVKGVIEAGGDDFKISGSLFGNRLCIHPDDPDAVRYNLTLAVDEISFANGLLNISNTKVEAIARGPYRGEDDYNLTIFDWRINAAADILVNVDADNFALRIHGAAEFVMEMDAITPAENFSVVANDTKPGVVELLSTKIRASVAFSYGYPGDSFHMNVTARAKFSWPCHTFMTLDGSLKLNFGGDDVDFGKMSVGFTLFCHDPDAYSAHSVYAIEVFTDHSLKNQTETLVRDFDDYEVFDEIAAIEAAEDAQFAPPPPKEASCEHSAQEIVADSFWGASNVRTVHSKFQALTELEKAHDHLDSMRKVDGYQLCNARIKLVTQEYKQNMIEQMSIFGELNHTEYSALRNNPRMAWELIASLDEPMSFAGGKFTISNILLNLRAYDKEGHRAPAMQKQDLLPDMDLQYYDIYGDFTATTDIDVETDAATASATAMRTSSAALGAFSLEATATLEADLSLIDDQFSFLWNLTVKMEMFVNTTQFRLHMRGEYNKPCNRVGVDALGVMHIDVPGAIELHNAIVSGTLYCEGQDPRVVGYLGIDSLVLADILEIEQVRVHLRSVTPAGAGPGLDSLDWKLNVTGQIRFDKMLEKMPSLSSKDTVIRVEAWVSVTGGNVALDLIIIDFDFDIKYQGSQPASNPMLHVYGGADFIWPW